MSCPRPDPSFIFSAMETYLRLAYEGPAPLVVQSQLRKLQAAGAELYQSAVVAREPANFPTRYAIRLGNRHYPHMKLVVALAPDETIWLFHADTHDRHVCPPTTSPEYDQFCSLMGKNQKIAEAIESAWAEQGLPTFKTYLRNDLARRQAAMK